MGGLSSRLEIGSRWHLKQARKKAQIQLGGPRIERKPPLGGTQSTQSPTPGELVQRTHPPYPSWPFQLRTKPQGPGQEVEQKGNKKKDIDWFSQILKYSLLTGKHCQGRLVPLRTQDQHPLTLKNAPLASTAEKYRAASRARLAIQ